MTVKFDKERDLKTNNEVMEEEARKLVRESPCGFLISRGFRNIGKTYRTHGYETAILKASLKAIQVEAQSQHRIPLFNRTSVASQVIIPLLSPQKYIPNSKHNSAGRHSKRGEQRGRNSYRAGECSPKSVI